MKRYIICCFCGILVGLVACYEDKGNYSYGEINEMTLSFYPETNSSNKNMYVFPQPTDDTLYVELTPVVSQTRQTDEQNLEYRWQIFKEKVDNVEKFDTVYSKTFLFKFAPGVLTVYDMLFSVRDKHTGVECYRRLKLRTIVPFIRSWLILHGREGDRKIAALEYDTTGRNVTRRVEDICYEVKKERRYQNAFAMTYVTDGLPYAMNDKDRLYILEKERCYWIHPFTCEERGRTEEMMPDGWSGRFLSCFSANSTMCAGILDEAGNYFHCGAFGYYYKAKYKNGVTAARIDRAYTSLRGHGYTTLWDNTNKKLMYYKVRGSLYASREHSRQSESIFDSQNLIDVFPDKMMHGLDMQNTELIWLGHSVKNTHLKEGTAIFYNVLTDEYHLLNIGYEQNSGEEEPEFVTTGLQKLKHTDFTRNSCFAATEAFSDQIFYSSGSEVYLYNTVNGSSTFLITVGQNNKINKLAFRMESKGTIKIDYDAVKILGIGVETANGEGEFHELFLNEAGDVVKHEIYSGFGPIVDFCYTYLSHRYYEI